MQLLANENFPAPAIKALRDAGHDVFWVRTETPGAKDAAILQQAQQKHRIVLTFDKDFGELAFHFAFRLDRSFCGFRRATNSPSKLRLKVAVDLTACTRMFRAILLIGDDRRDHVVGSVRYGGVFFG